MSESFATLLQKARRNCRDPQRGGLITQERFVELLSQRMGDVRAPTAATLSNWERGRSRPSSHDRAMLCALIAVLLHCGGLDSLADASVLLTRGGYAPLTQAEAQWDQEVMRTLAAAGAQTRSPAIEATFDTTTDVTLNAPDMTPAPLVEAYMPQGNGRTPGPDAPCVQAITLIAIRHQSMEQIPAKAIVPALPAALQGCEYIEVVIDQCDLFQQGRLADPYAAVCRQRDIEEHVTTLLARYPEAHLAYYGIAHIPLIFLAGYTLSNRRALLQFENERYTRSWDLLQRGGIAPELKLSGLPPQVEWGYGDVAVRMSISYRVLEEVVTEVIPAPLASIELGLEQPQIDSVTSEQQLRVYTQVFRQMMDLIHQRLPQATGIHLFYAGPPSLAFRCGQQISKTIHPRMVVYNYVGMDVPKYSWGLDMTRHCDAVDFLVRPAAS